MTQYNPDVQLDHRERASLALTASEEGFSVLQKIIRSEVDKFVVDLINADSANESEVLEKHRISKVAAQLYQGWVDRVNHEIQNYTSELRGQEVMADPTEGQLDFGPHVDRGGVDTSPLEGGEDEY